MQTKEVMELSKQIRQKMKDIDGFGKFGHRFFLCSIMACNNKEVCVHTYDLLTLLYA
jgi:hypothetical protein